MSLSPVVITPCVCVCVSCTGVPDQINHSLIVTTPISLASMSVRFPTPSDNNSPITAYMYMLCQGPCANSATPTTTMNYQDGDGYILFTIGGLIPNSVYTLRVAAVNEAGNGPTPTNDTDAHTFNSSTSGACVPGVCVGVCGCVCRDWELCVLFRYCTILKHYYLFNESQDRLYVFVNLTLLSSYS